MSETAECPYCGSSVKTQRVVDYDDKIKLRCSSCGGLFEYMPGFGSFSLPDPTKRDSVLYQGPIDLTQPDDFEMPWTTERPPTEGGECERCCAIVCILCFILPVITWIIFFFSLLDLFF